MKNKVKILIVFLVLIIFPILIYIFLFSTSSLINKGIKGGNKIVSSIEEYRNNKGYIPDSFKDINLIHDEVWGGMATCINGINYYYEKINEKDYIIYFDYSLGESVIYYSETKSWK